MAWWSTSTARRAIADSPDQFVLLPIANYATRLLFRETLRANTPSGGAVGAVAGRLLWESVHFVMVQRMLRASKSGPWGNP